MSTIQGQHLDVTVVACKVSQNNPYVCIGYADSKFSTGTCKDGSKNPASQETFHIPLVEGLRELEISVWNINFLRHDDNIGNGRVKLDKVLSEGYDDSPWPIRTQKFKAAGEVKLIMHYSGASKPLAPSASDVQPSAPPSPCEPRPQYAQQPPFVYPNVGGYPYNYAPVPSPHPPYYNAGYAPPPMAGPYPPAAYHPAPYQPYGQGYQSPTYGQAYQPPPAAQPPYYAPQGPYPGAYPPQY